MKTFTLLFIVATCGVAFVASQMSGGQIGMYGMGGLSPPGVMGGQMRGGYGGGMGNQMRGNSAGQIRSQMGRMKRDTIPSRDDMKNIEEKIKQGAEEIASRVAEGIDNIKQMVNQGMETFQQGRSMMNHEQPKPQAQE
ncbi:hypothetical protein PV328_004748 [Microctonus aethiopoides]|uniref:Uncharacterized protein n=1 Tax=Microctonus aethiopoides TaxID=144406 RepID=A0AA39KLW7_9HYME|nr:hypothetical protein PV328_004748 [Microctonus aethiopoides]